MFAPFIWMFKVENFKKHFLYLFFTYIKFFIIALILYFALTWLVPQYNFYNIYAIVLQLIGITLPALCISGYFWELTFSIINRDTDIQASSIYNGKIKVVENITLPEIKTLKFIWRGFASCIATLIMFLPFIIFVLTSSFVGLTILYKIYYTFSVAYLACFAMIMFLVPGLLWNYAKQNSVVSTLNIFKAIYIAGNYPGKYIWNSILYIITISTFTGIFCGLAYLLQMNFSTFEYNALFIIKMLIMTLALYTWNIYSLYIYAYLLGTIAPVAEA